MRKTGITLWVVAIILAAGLSAILLRTNLLAGPSARPSSASSNSRAGSPPTTATAPTTTPYRQPAAALTVPTTLPTDPSPAATTPGTCTRRCEAPPRSSSVVVTTAAPAVGIRVTSPLGTNSWRRLTAGVCRSIWRSPGSRSCLVIMSTPTARSTALMPWPAWSETSRRERVPQSLGKADSTVARHRRAWASADQRTPHPGESAYLVPGARRPPP